MIKLNIVKSSVNHHKPKHTKIYIAHSVACITITFTPKAPELAFSFHELGDEASLPDLRLLIQQYFDIVDYVVSLYGQTRPIRALLCSYQGTWQAKYQSPLAARILLQCELCAV
jgi:hypothetical protein